MALSLHTGLVFVQHQCGNALQGVSEAQRLKSLDHLLHRPKIPPQELAPVPCRCFPSLRWASLLLKPRLPLVESLLPCIGGHADHRVGEIHPVRPWTSLILPLVQDLQQDIHDIGGALFDLVKQHHTVRAAAQLLGELACLLVAL